MHDALGGFLVKELIDRFSPQWYSRVIEHVAVLALKRTGGSHESDKAAQYEL